jgi:hypothetical protein
MIINKVREIQLLSGEKIEKIFTTENKKEETMNVAH